MQVHHGCVLITLNLVGVILQQAGGLNEYRKDDR